jgi:hypothetical protein
MVHQAGANQASSPGWCALFDMTGGADPRAGGDAPNAAWHRSCNHPGMPVAICTVEGKPRGSATPVDSLQTNS